MPTFENFPDACPPADAIDAFGEVYRLVWNDPPAASDFRTHMETEKMPHADPCLRAGLSVFREKRDAAHQRDLLPYLGNRIARAVLQARHGKVKQTKGKQPTHTTWWVCTAVNRDIDFTVISEGGANESV